MPVSQLRLQAVVAGIGGGVGDLGDPCEYHAWPPITVISVAGQRCLGRCRKGAEAEERRRGHLGQQEGTGWPEGGGHTGAAALSKYPV